MSIIIDGTNGISDIDGTASTPAIRGTDANTGIFFPAADTVAFAEGGTEVARFDSSGNFGIGTSSPVANNKLTIDNGANAYGLIIQNTGGNDAGFQLRPNGTTQFYFTSNTNGNASMESNGATVFRTNSAERARITSGGTIGINTTSPDAATVLTIKARSGENGMAVKAGTNGNYGIYFNNTSDATQGGIVINSGSVSYNTTSDYRLKENVQPLSGCLARVLQLKPCTYVWKADGSTAEGFIAHELAEICPQAVSGEKDAVDVDGNPQYQGVDTSFLVATLTAAIQELKAELDATKAEVAALKAKE